MRLAGRVSAAIDVLTEMFDRHRPASEALKDWGKAHRFAGSTDRHAIGTLVYDALRRRNALSHRMGAGTPRALALAGLKDAWGLSAEAIAAMAEEQHGPGALTPDELAALSRDMPSALPLHVAADVPEWLAPSYERAFGARAAEEGQPWRSAHPSISASTR
jgi:16S rRNA (cytosine967-C5)-methyltransferase